jgi:hypothetical protein
MLKFFLFMAYNSKFNQTAATPVNAAAYHAGAAGISRPSVNPFRFNQPATCAAGNVVQRVINLNGALIYPHNYQLFIQTVEQAFKIKGYGWTPQHAAVLTGWLQEHDHIITAADVEVVADNLFLHGDNYGSWVNMNKSAIAPPEMKKAQHRRRKHRASLLLTPSSVQTAKTVTGMSKLKDSQLLRLTERGKEEDEHWVRREDGSLTVVKKRKLGKNNEARIVATGDPKNPSYVVWKNNRQLGHRYKGSKKPVNHSKKRTYGDKKGREGYEYKGSGLVDGHSVQAQDDQLILGPFRKDATHWQTTPKTTGTPETYDDSKYLPEDENDKKKFIERHPYNFYWENQEQGKHFRQKGIEAPALKNETSFLHLNDYSGGYTFNPNSGTKQQHSYEVPGRIDYLVEDTSGGQDHLVVDNRPQADYSKPAKYDPAKNLYPDVKGAPSHKKNKSLGNLDVADHLKLAKQANTSKFPFSTVLTPHDPAFSYKPESRYDDDGYQTPPPSPFHTMSSIEEEQVVEKEDRTELLDFEHQKKLVEKAKYDSTKKQTTLTLSSLKKGSDPSSWKLPKPPSGGTPVSNGANISAKDGTGYLPTLQQNQALTARNLTLRWVVPDGYCIFGSWGASANQSAATVQQTVINALNNNTHNVQHWIENVYGGGSAFTWQQVLRAVRYIDAYWNMPIADIILPLVSFVYQQGVTIIDVNGIVTDLNGGGRVLLKVTNPNEHYHAAL